MSDDAEDGARTRAEIVRLSAEVTRLTDAVNHIGVVLLQAATSADRVPLKSLIAVTRTYQQIVGALILTIVALHTPELLRFFGWQ